MKTVSDKCFKRLPVTFHRTFVPERHYLKELMRFAAQSGEGTDQDISDQTRIPMGKSDGKVPAAISYGQGMGLIQLAPGSKPGRRAISLTHFGRVVFLDDPNMSEPLTQWLLHVHLCRRSGGAEVWYVSFAVGRAVLGMSFSEADLETFLEKSIGKRNRSILGPLVRTYDEPAALAAAKVFDRRGDSLVRNPGPILGSFRNGYAAFFLELFENHFPDERQVTITDFECETFWRNMNAWNDKQVETILAMIEELGAIQVDKQMHPWVITRLGTAAVWWPQLYADLA